MSPGTPHSDWHIRLRRVLDTSFTQSELESLGAALPVSFAALPGESRAEQIAALIAAYSKAQRAPELIEHCGELHPELRWELLWHGAVRDPFAVVDAPDPVGRGVPEDPMAGWEDTIATAGSPSRWQDPVWRKRWLWALLVLSIIMGAQSSLSGPADPPATWQGTGPGGVAPTDVPFPLEPSDGTVFTTEPGPTTLEWTPVEIDSFGSYAVEVDCFGCCRERQWCTDVGETYLVDRLVEDTTWTFSWFGTQPGRWRVWAVSTNGVEYPKSAWSEFRYQP